MNIGQKSKQSLVALLFFWPGDLFILEESKGCTKWTTSQWTSHQDSHIVESIIVPFLLPVCWLLRTLRISCLLVLQFIASLWYIPIEELLHILELSSTFTFFKCNTQCIPKYKQSFVDNGILTWIRWNAQFRGI